MKLHGGAVRGHDLNALRYALQHQSNAVVHPVDRRRPSSRLEHGGPIVLVEDVAERDGADVLRPDVPGFDFDDGQFALPRLQARGDAAVSG